MRNNKIVRTVMVICSVLVVAAASLGVHHIVSFAASGFENADKYSAGDAVITDTVRNLDIDWTSGNIIFEYHDGDTVEISETSRRPLGEDRKMRWKLDGDTLRIRFAKKEQSFFSFGFNQDKTLTVTLPESIKLSDVAIDSTSGDVMIPSLTVEELTLDVVSGDIRLDVSGAEQFRVSSVSGNVEATLDDVRNAEVDTTSGDVKLGASGLEKLNISTTSGNVTAALPEDPGFTAHLDTVSGDIAYDLPLSKEGGAYVCGDGSKSVKIDTVSGNITIQVS